MRWNVWKKRMKNISRVELFTVQSRLTQQRVLSSVERRENKQTLNNSWSWMLLDYSTQKKKLHKHAMISLWAEVSSTLLHYADLASEREEHSCGRAGMWSRSCECFPTLFSSTSATLKVSWVECSQSNVLCLTFMPRAPELCQHCSVPGPSPKLVDDDEIRAKMPESSRMSARLKKYVKSCATCLCWSIQMSLQIASSRWDVSRVEWWW